MTDDLVPALVIAAARSVADAAAAASNVTIRQAHTLADIELVRHVVDQVWSPQPDEPSVAVPMLWPLAHVGNYCSLAFDRASPEGPPIGVCISFLGLHPTYSLHSHAAGVVSSAGGRRIGTALKLDQRAWALEHGIARMTWTFDPLVRRNAFFNVTKLGARPIEYLVDFYGAMSDAINVGQGSDRLMVSWDLAAPETVRRLDRQVPEPDAAQLVRAGAVTVVGDADGEPSQLNPTDAMDLGFAINAVLLVQVPADIEGMRSLDPDRARRWRFAVRSTLGELVTAGWPVRAVTREGHYVLRRNG
jgi:predicted GNAT superfamily acetyltransferase